MVVGLNKAILTLCAIGALAIPSLSSAQSDSSIWDGVYSEEQAKRGAITFAEVCTACHGEDLRGDSNTPSLVGVSFMFLWEQRSLAELFVKMQTEMPTSNPGSLPDDSYRDLVAYLLKMNRFPSGADDLSADPEKIGRIFIVPQP